MLNQKGKISKNTENVDKWLKVIRQLSHDTSCEKEVERTLSVLSKINGDKIKIAFVGAPNSGKSSIINGLLERKIIPVTALSSVMEFEIRPTADEQIENFSFRDVSKPLKELKETLSSLEEKREFCSLILTVSSNWLSSKSFVLLERPPLDPLENSIEEVIDEYLLNSDIIALVIDALMPVKKAEQTGLPPAGKTAWIPIYTGNSWRTEENYPEEKTRKLLLPELFSGTERS
jgi:hypothetical protein